MKGYRLWGPTDHRVIISRDIIFAEDQLQGTENDSTRKESIEFTKIQVDCNNEEKDSSKATPGQNNDDLNETEEIRF